MRKPKPPPLDHPHWLPSRDIHAVQMQRSGNGHRAARDLTEALASGRVRCMRRSVADGRRELVPATWPPPSTICRTNRAAAAERRAVAATHGAMLRTQSAACEAAEAEATRQAEK
jgi:hypothetical protein